MKESKNIYELLNHMNINLEDYEPCLLYTSMEKGVCTEESWQEAIKADYPYEFLKAVPAGNEYRLEGFLFPDTYYIEENTSSREIVDMMLKNFAAIWDREFADQAQTCLLYTSRCV